MLIKCDFCGAQISRAPSKLKRHNFCSRRCLGAFASAHSAEYADHSKAAAHMAELNRALNKTRMTAEVRSKLRARRLEHSECHGYEKTFGVHTHRLVAAEKLGRPLHPGEVVHHLDGDKRNNAPSNLMVFASQAEHARWHKLHNKEVMHNG